MSRTAIGSSRPSVLRSSGTSAMPQARDLALAGLPGAIGAAVERDLALHAAQYAEQCQHQLALALAIEPAQADDLALADGESEVATAARPSRGRQPRRQGAAGPLRCGLGG